MGSRRREEEVEEWIETQCASGRRVFWPEQLVRNGLGTLDEVMRLLKPLVDSGKLVAVVQIQNENGETCWEGSLDEFAKLNFPELQEQCDALPELEGHTYLHFDVAREWLESSKKKRRSWST